jgi:hypothetical protein
MKIENVIRHHRGDPRDGKLHSVELIEHVCVNGHTSIIIDIAIPGTATIVACLVCSGTRLVNRPDYDGPEP